MTCRPLLACLVSILLAACTLKDARMPDSPMPAALGEMTLQNRALRAVPMPEKRVTVAIYDLPDQTGQYKESSTSQNLSRAVSQGGAAILVKALQDAGEKRWFSVLDRSALDNLLRERQIVTEMRRIYRGEDQIDASVLGPLSTSGLLIEGAIIGYDSNTMTGGYGARYLGIGGDRKWKLDVVTVTLRLLATETGEVLASVVVRKPIASVSTRGSIFTYVAMDEILEAELGQASNEPRQIALEQAVEKAVMALIAEGAMSGAWAFADRDAGDAWLAAYLRSKFDGDVSRMAAEPLQVTRPGALTVRPTVPRRPPPAPQMQVRQLPPAATQPGPQPTARRLPPPNGPQGQEVLG